MSESAAPTGWSLERDETNYDEFHERTFTRLVFRAADGTTVRITDVQEPNSFGGWGYLIRTDEPIDGDLGLVETLDEAKAVAESFMCDYQEAAR